MTTSADIRQVMVETINERSDLAHAVSTESPDLLEDYDDEDNFSVDYLDRWGDRRVPPPHL